MSTARVVLLTFAALILLAAAAITIAYRHDLAAARALTAGNSRLIDSPFGPIEYAEAGQGPPILVIHGAGGGFDQGLMLGRGLTAKGFRVIAPSRFGYLRSALPAGASPRLQAEALAFLMGQLGVSRAAILGVSAGAHSALELALARPDLCRGLVLMVPAPETPDLPPAPAGGDAPAIPPAVLALMQSDFGFWAASKLAPDLLTRTVLGTDPALVARAPAAERTRVHAVLMSILPIGARRRGLDIDGAVRVEPPAHPLTGLTCPVLAITAADDGYGTARAAVRIAREAPQASLILHPDGGHLLVGHDAETTDAIAGFARGLAP